MTSFRVTGYLRSSAVICCHMTAFCELQPCRKSNAQYMSVFGLLLTSRWLPVKWRHFRVTSDHLSSCDVLSCHVTAFFRKLQPCRKSNTQYTTVFGLLQPLPGDFRSNDVTSESLPVTWGHVTSYPVTWLPLPARYSLVGSQMHSIRKFSIFYIHFQVTSGQMSSLPSHFRSSELTWRHFPSRDCLFLQAKPCRKINAQYTPVFGLPQPLPGGFRWNDATSGSLPVTWSHLKSRDAISCMWLSFSASNSLVGSFRLSTATSRLLQVK